MPSICQDIKGRRLTIAAQEFTEQKNIEIACEVRYNSRQTVLIVFNHIPQENYVYKYRFHSCESNADSEVHLKKQFFEVHDL